MEFKVGDKVRMKSLEFLQTQRLVTPLFLEEFDCLAGEVMKIEDTHMNGVREIYNLEGQYGSFISAWFDKAQNSTEEIILEVLCSI